MRIHVVGGYHKDVVHDLKPGQSVDMANGYVGRSQPDGAWYYATRCDDRSAPIANSPTFGTYADALAWLGSFPNAATTKGPT